MSGSSDGDCGSSPLFACWPPWVFENVGEIVGDTLILMRGSPERGRRLPNSIRTTAHTTANTMTPMPEKTHCLFCTIQFHTGRSQISKDYIRCWQLAKMSRASWPVTTPTSIDPWPIRINVVSQIRHRVFVEAAS